MPKSGVKVPDEIKHLYEDLKLHQNGGELLKYFTIRITDDNHSMEIVNKIKMSVPENTDADWETFKAELKEAAEVEGECRYAVYDFKFVTESGISNSKLCFIYWGPDNVKSKQKMLYSTSKEDLTLKLGTGFIEFGANDFDDLDPAEMEKKLSKKI